ncbi:hypothetical protein PR003_g24363 [Phytophthora rubi]|uniref:Uncharacterized protein n=1 Tax=Phytophthora rubi TaxID=129364 RepID=A0A6A3H533_9STRA|nr:hypothetical protein PR002_g28979 [Phytophthora rubi]KAE8964911.1 hypothetical protein PR001_g28894 [Phytophthora rubi]KAE9294023.1 hypothetical protein PR003_g24363 [Phytophthora rubi]
MAATFRPLDRREQSHFSLRSPPRIDSISHEALVKWMRDRREYEAKLRARCRVSGESYDAVVESVVDAFESDLLDVFCDLKLHLPLKDVTEGMLLTEIKSIVDSVKNSTLPDIKALFKKELKMNMGESDVAARVLDYFRAFNRIMMDNGLKECFQDADGSREKCKRLTASLQPASLKKEVKQCVRFTDKAAATDPRRLFDLIVDKATEHERQYQRLKEQLQKATTGRNQNAPWAPKPAPDMQQKRWEGKDKKPLAMVTPAATTPVTHCTSTQASKPPRGKSSRPPPGPCPKCNEMHWLRECTQVTTEEKEELFRRLRDAKTSKKTRVKRLGEMRPPTDRMVTLNGVFELPYCPDSGSDFTIIGQSHWQQLRATDATLEAERLGTPVRSQAFGSTWVTAEWKAELHVLIHTAAGPVEPMESVDVLVADVDDDEFIVGNDLLTTLGINVDQQLEQLAGRGDDETSGDSIDLKADDLPLHPGQPESSGDDVFAAVERMISRAVENGFLVDQVEQLRTIVHAYDVWRLEPRADPPANVPPLEVRLRGGACLPKGIVPADAVPNPRSRRGRGRRQASVGDGESQASRGRTRSQTARQVLISEGAMPSSTSARSRRQPRRSSRLRM